MPNNRLSVLFDRKSRHSKSTSDLSSEIIPQHHPGQPEWRQSKRSQPRQTPTVMQEHGFNKPLPPPPAHTAGQARRIVGQHQHRSSTAPVLYPPDELFLKMIRRRSANALLEEMRIQEERKHDPGLAMSLAIASAVPPMYFDPPPGYTSPESDLPLARAAFPLPGPRIIQLEPSHHLQSRGTISRLKEDELFLDDHLKLQIDEAIAQYASIQVTGPTPVTSPREASVMVSPMNDIDHIYLEKRKQKKNAQR